MIQFNFNRFVKLAKWSLTNDKKYHVKTFLQTLVIMTLVFLFLTSITVTFGKDNANYQACSIATIILFASTFIVGSSFMFYSMERKNDMQALLMLPASNFEKYLMRYVSWILLLPLYLVATVAADLVQYVFGLVVGHEEVRFVISATMEMLGKAWSQVPAEKHSVVVIGLALPSYGSSRSMPLAPISSERTNTTGFLRRLSSSCCSCCLSGSLLTEVRLNS